MAYSNKVTQMFGDDLYPLLGPKANRVPWHSLSYKEQQKRLDKCPDYVTCNGLGKVATFEDMFILCIQQLINLGQDNNPLYGIDIPQFDSLEDASVAMNFPPLVYANLADISSFVQNNETQRHIFLRHIIEDIVCDFKPHMVSSGLGRMDSKGRLFVNDGKHRTIGCMFFGIEQVGIPYLISDDTLYDIEQYRSENITPLAPSEFDKYRIRVQAAEARINAGKEPYESDKVCHFLHEVFEGCGVTVTEKGDPEGSKSNGLTGVGNMIKYTVDYGEDFMKAAIEFDARTFPSTVFKTANAWGIAEFLKAQDQDAYKNNYFQMMDEISKAIKIYLPEDRSGNKLHASIKQAIKDQNPELTSIRNEPKVIAKGIYKIVSRYSTDNSWEWNDIEFPSDFQYDFEMDLI